MGTTTHTAGVACRPEIARLIRAAKAAGSPDIYAGKRRATRIAEGIQLEVTADPQNESASFSVTMHDISEGGVSFWSRCELDVGAILHVREFSSGSPPSWIPVRVKHRTMGIRGCLVGTAFEVNSMSTAASAPPQARRGPAAPPQMLPPGWRGPRP